MRRVTVAVVVLAVLTLLVGAGAVEARPFLPDAGMAKKRSVDVAGFDKQHGPQSQIECVAAGTGNVKLDCDDPFPNNEPDIEVDPADARHMIASSNDYGTCCDQFYTTFDAGQHWTTGNMSREKPQKIGSDPVTVFDRRHGVAIHASLSYKVQHAAGTQACDGDLVVSISRDGGLIWELPVVVDDGIGCDLSATQLFNDKEWIVTDNNSSSRFYGRTYLTWSKFESHFGAYASSAIWGAFSDDGGDHWSTPKEISGSNPALCTFQWTGPAGECDQNQFSVPTVQPNGTVFVAFQNEQNESIWDAGEQFEDQYLVIRSNDGGVTWSSPAFVVALEDGSRDYPRAVTGRQTLSGYQLRVNSAGNIVASPTSGNLFLVFSDNRNGTHDTANPVTNTDVFVMTSSNGTTWTEPARVDASGSDQWFPWVEVNPATGSIGIVYNDRSTTAPTVYNASLAEGTLGALTKSVVSTAASHPTESRFFRAQTPGCMNCATFHGDYIAISYGSDGKANMTWTDMRDPNPTATGLFDQFIYFARKYKDTTAPTFTGISVAGSLITVTFSEPVCRAIVGGAWAQGDWTINNISSGVTDILDSGDSIPTCTAAADNGVTTAVIDMGTTTITPGAFVEVTLNTRGVGTAASDNEAIQDSAGNFAVAPQARQATASTPETTAPTLVSATGSVSSSIITLNFSEPVYCTAGLDLQRQ